jgi:hypothetical protein
VGRALGNHKAQLEAWGPNPIIIIINENMTENVSKRPSASNPVITVLGERNKLFAERHGARKGNPELGGQPVNPGPADRNDPAGANQEIIGKLSLGWENPSLPKGSTVLL